LQSVYRQTGILPEELTYECPKLFNYLWIFFSNLSSVRSSNGYFANPLSYTEIKAWSELMVINLHPEEVRILRIMDNQFLIYQAKQAKKKAN
jgi:hypothetical protein